MNKRLVYIVVLLSIVFSCKKDEISEVFTTDLELVVTNQFFLPYANTDVYLYDDYDDFKKETEGETVPYLLTKKTNSEGKVIFDGLDATKKYYFLVKSGDKTNENTSYTLKDNLIKGAVTTAIIILESTESYITFCSQ